jgi:hypothetical protein
MIELGKDLKNVPDLTPRSMPFDSGAPIRLGAVGRVKDTIILDVNGEIPSDLEETLNALPGVKVGEKVEHKPRIVEVSARTKKALKAIEEQLDKYYQEKKEEQHI